MEAGLTSSLFRTVLQAEEGGPCYIVSARITFNTIQRTQVAILPYFDLILVLFLNLQDEPSHSYV